MKFWIFGLLLFITVLLQGSVTTIPLTFIALILLYSFYKSEWVFVVAAVCGIFLDVMLVRPVGQTSIFFLLCLFFIFLYQRKFEIASYYFIFLSLFFSSSIYGFLFGVTNVLFTAFVTATTGTIMFFIFQRFRSQ